MTNYNPPLLGDEHGNYRIQIIGNSGTGKTTHAAYLSEKLNLPHIPLDKIAWKPGWKKTQEEELREKVRALMAQYTRGWIIDGDYRVLGTLIPDDTTDIIWLDPPLHRYFPRLLWRTLLRILGLRPSCAEGCVDSWREIFSSKGIVWFCVTNHATARIKYSAWLARIRAQGGRKMIRLDESRGELAGWKDEFERYLERQ